MIPPAILIEIKENIKEPHEHSLIIQIILFIILIYLIIDLFKEYKK